MEPLPFELGMPGPQRDRLIAQVLSGEKTATSSLLAQYHDEPLPVAGVRQAMVNSDNVPVATVEILEVKLMRLGDADDQLAHDEGEGFADAAAWRDAHEHFWRTHIISDLPTPLTLDDDTQVVVERFRVVSD
jgi:uncharacterized protein YhfF